MFLQACQEFCPMGEGVCMVKGDAWQGDVHGEGDMHDRGQAWQRGPCMAEGGMHGREHGREHA